MSKQHDSIFTISISLIVLLAIASLLVVISSRGRYEVRTKGKLAKPEQEQAWTGFHAMIEQNNQQKGSQSMIIGYSYYLLERFASSQKIQSDIRKADSQKEAIASLLDGSVDIISIPADRKFPLDSTMIVSDVLDDFCKWVMRADCTEQMAIANKWIDDYHNMTERSVIRNSYMIPHSPWKGNYSFASPYDAIIKAGAKEIGWDWRMLAAVLHIESQFHIEAKSPTGPEGMGQFAAKTAAQFGITNTLDPKQNIFGCARYLKSLSRSFSGYDSQERMNLTLAAYNGGPGRVLESLRYADSCGLEHNWAGAKKAILLMNRDSIQVEGSDTLIANPNKKNWTETAYFVDKVLSRYHSYCKRLPEN